MNSAIEAKKFPSTKTQAELLSLFGVFAGVFMDFAGVFSSLSLFSKRPKNLSNPDSVRLGKIDNKDI